MLSCPELIVMFTQHDYTVSNACELLKDCIDTPVRYWGIKETGLSLEEMKAFFSCVKDHHKIGVLEVVAYTENECFEAAEKAIACGCDILMGTVFFDSVNELCRSNQIQYMPFVGQVSERPSVLEGREIDILHQAEQYLQKGVFGVDLLSYRYVRDPHELNELLISNVQAPVCIAGSIDSYERLNEVLELSPWAFTIGSAFFDHAFGNSFCEQIECVCQHMQEFYH